MKQDKIHCIKRKLGNTKLSVSEIGLGCRSIGGNIIINGKGTTFANISFENAQKIINKAIDLGITVFDTSDSYSLGNSEKRLGDIVKKKRNEIQIFTKAGSIITPKNSEIDLSYNHLIAALNRSLKRLQTSYVDLFQTHTFPRTDEEVNSVRNTFDFLKSENKINYCGISVGNNIQKGIEILQQDFVDCLQVSFSMINKNALDELLPLAYKKGVGIIVNRPLAEGFLSTFQTKKITNNFDLRSNYSKERITDITTKLKNLSFLKKEKFLLNQIAIKYVLSKKEVSTCLISSNTEKQLLDNVSSTHISIKPEILRKIDIS